MKYYLLSHSAEEKIVGEWPQTIPTEVVRPDGSDAPHSRSKFTNKHFPTEHLDLTF